MLVSINVLQYLTMIVNVLELDTYDKFKILKYWINKRQIFLIHWHHRQRVAVLLPHDLFLSFKHREPTEEAIPVGHPHGSMGTVSA